MLAGDLNDLRQFTLDVQLEGVLIRSLSHAGHAGDIFKPFHRGRASKADLYLVLVEIFERGDMIDLDQLAFADDRDAVAGLLYFWVECARRGRRCVPQRGPRLPFYRIPAG